MTWKEKIEISGLALALLGLLSKLKVFEIWTEGLLKDWQAKRSRRQLARRLSDPEIDQILEAGHEELETICLIILKEYRCDRVTVVEFSHATRPPLATCIVEARTPQMHSVKKSIQRQPLLPSLWRQVELAHERACRCLHVPNAQLLDNVPALRTALRKTGVTTAYYQTLATASGEIGALLSLSWSQETPLTEEDLADLHYSGRLLGGMLRLIWPLEPGAGSSPSS